MATYNLLSSGSFTQIGYWSQAGPYCFADVGGYPDIPDGPGYNYFTASDTGAIPNNATINSVTLTSNFTFSGSPQDPDHRIFDSQGNRSGSNPSVWSIQPNSSAWDRASLFTQNYGIDPGNTVSGGAYEWNSFALSVSLTLALVTSVVTGPATNVSTTIATLNGLFNPNGATSAFPVTAYFQYGTSISYGGETTHVTGQTGSDSIALTSGITGLVAGTTYHYRIVTINADSAVTLGSDVTFVTTSDDPLVAVF